MNAVKFITGLAAVLLATGATFLFVGIVAGIVVLVFGFVIHKAHDEHHASERKRREHVEDFVRALQK